MVIDNNNKQVYLNEILQHLGNWLELALIDNVEGKIIKDLFYEISLYNSFKRIIACLINEKLVDYNIINFSKIDKDEPKNLKTNSNIWIVLQPKNTRNHENSQLVVNLDTDFVMLYEDSHQQHLFIDPDDLSTNMLWYTNNKCFNELKSVDQLFTRLLLNRTKKYEKEKIDQVIKEIQNSVDNQAMELRKHTTQEIKNNYQNLGLNRKAIEYEQSLIYGHHTHPMNKARFSGSQLFDRDTKHNKTANICNFISNYQKYDFNKPNICFYIVNKSKMNLYGEYEKLIKKVADKLNIEYDADNEIIVPVHELQANILENMFKDEIRPITNSLDNVIKYKALGQSSLRTVNIQNIEGYSFKLPLALIVTSAMRIITPWTIYIGPHINPILDMITNNDDDQNQRLDFLKEIGSINIKENDVDIAKHFGCIIREDPDSKINKTLNQTIIMCGYLTEKINTVPFKDTNGFKQTEVRYNFNINKMFDLRTQEQKDKFGMEYAQILLDAFFTPVYKYGLSFEAHLQNTLVKIQSNNANGLQIDYKILGFVIRDFGGIKVHQDTIKSKINMIVPVLNDESSVLAQDLESVYKLCYHTLFHCHLQLIFRALNMHHNSKGWKFVYNYLITKEEFMNNKTCKEFFLSKLAPYKCFITMKLNSMYRDYLYSNVPNLLTYHNYINKNNHLG